MKLVISKKSFPETVFFIMMWVFYSLNSRYLQIPAAELLRWVALGLLVLLVLIQHRKISAPPLLLLLFLIATLPSVIPSVDRKESIIKILSFLVVSYGTYIYFSGMQTREELDGAMRTILFVIVAFEVQSIGAILLGVGYDRTGERALGITTNANTLGGYSNLALLASFYYMTQRQGRKRTFWKVFLLASAVTAVLSGSRTGFVTLLVMACVLMYLQNRGTKKIIFVAAAGGILLWLLFSGRLSFLNIRGLNGLLSEGGTQRSDLWELGIDVWKRFPYFGCGYAVSNYYSMLDNMIGFDFHSSYITFLAEDGLWGAVIFGSTLVAYFVQFAKVYIKHIQKREISLFVVCGLMMAVQLIGAYSESFLFAVGSTEACTFWTLFSWSLVYRKRLLAEEQMLSAEKGI